MFLSFNNYIKRNKLGLFFYFLALVLLISTIIIRYYYLGIYPLSLFFIYFIFFLTQYFDFEYKYLIGSGLLFLIICFFLIVFRPKYELDYLFILTNQPELRAIGYYTYHRLADYFANYAFGFLVLGTIAIFLDNLKNKLKSKNSFGIYKKVFLSIIIVMLLVLPFLIYDHYECKATLKRLTFSTGNSAKNLYLKIFNKEKYYSKNNEAIIHGEVLEEKIKIFVNFPKNDSKISGNVKISGAAIEKNSKLDPGIDKVVFFLDGDATNGKYLGEVEFMSKDLEGDNKTIAYINNSFIQFFNRRATDTEFKYWITNLEYNIYRYEEFARSLLDNYEFRARKLSNEEFINILYRGLFKRNPDRKGLIYWLDQMEGGLDKNSIINIFLESNEFKIPIEAYYRDVDIRKEPLSIYRKSIGDEYGKQFYLSGFSFEFGSTKFSNGKYEIYIYAHSPIFGWDYTKLKIQIEN